MAFVEQIMANGQVIIALAIFFVSYVIIISEKINRSIIAMCGAILMVAFGIVDLHTASTHHIHWETIFLLFGMMILVAIANRSGVFEYIAIKTAQSAQGDPKKILVRLALLTAVGSAFIDIVTMVLLITPITIAITRILHMKPVPFLITEIMLCNIGGAATLVGDPPNIMIGIAAGFSFNDFLIHITPLIICIIVIVITYLVFRFKDHLQVKEEYKQGLMDIDAREYIRDTALAKKSLIVFMLTLLGFVLQQFLQIEPALVALSGAAVLLLIGIKESDLEEVYHSVEWVTIFFFIGLFVLVGGLVEVGVIGKAASWMIDLTNGDTFLTSLALLWGTGLASGFLDNIPLVATMIPMVQDIGTQLALSSSELSTLWWSLALGACLGGNGTLIASSANLIVVSIAIREGAPISFVDFLKVSIPVTVLSLALATIYVYFVFIKLGFA